MTAATCPSARPCAARIDAAPSVGPTQGVQATPRSTPRTNWPPTPSKLRPRAALSTVPPIRPATTAKRASIGGTSSTRAQPISSAAATIRSQSASRPRAKPIVATNSPAAVNDKAMPAANAAGAHRCRAIAAPKTIGTIGSTHGERIDSAPAKKAKTALPATTGRLFLRRADQLLDRGSVGLSDRAAGLTRPAERDQGALHVRAETADDVLLGIEIDREDDQIPERRLGGESVENRLLCRAGRAPRRANVDQDRLAGALCGFEARGIEGLRLGGEARCRQDQRHQQNEQDAKRAHGKVRLSVRRDGGARRRAAALAKLSALWPACGKRLHERLSRRGMHGRQGRLPAAEKGFLLTGHRLGGALGDRFRPSREPANKKTGRIVHVFDTTTSRNGTGVCRMRRARLRRSEPVEHASGGGEQNAHQYRRRRPVLRDRR